MKKKWKKLLCGLLCIGLLTESTVQGKASAPLAEQEQLPAAVEPETEQNTAEEQKPAVLKESVAEPVTGSAVSVIELSLPLYQEGSSEPAFEGRTESRETRTFYDYILEKLRQAEKKIPVKEYLKNMDREKQVEVVKQTVTNVINDNPDLFYVKKTVTCYMDAADQNMLAVHPSYKAAGTKLENLREALEKKISEALSWLEEGMSEREKALALHEYLTLHTYISAGGSLENGAYGAYGALVDGKAVSQGYALAYRLLLSRAGIDSEVVISTKDNKTGHYWNIVRIDGKYYHIDVERDDSDGTKKEADRYDDMGYSLHEYFMLSDTAMKKYRDTWYAKGLKAEDTSYDGEDYFLRGIQKGMFYHKGYWYYVSQEGTLQKAAMDGEIQTVDTVHFVKASTIARKGKELYVNVNFLSGMIGIAALDLDNENIITNIWYFSDNPELDAFQNQMEITNLEACGDMLRYVVRDKKKTPPEGFMVGTISLLELGGIKTPDKIKDLRIGNSTEDSITLSWSAAEGASEYLIYESSENEYRLLARTKKTSLKIKGVPDDQVFEYEVMATRKEKVGNRLVYWMGESAYVLASAAPKTPGFTEIKAALEGGISLSWERAEGADGYEVYRSEKKSEAWTLLGETRQLEFLDKTAVCGKSYLYKLRAYRQLDLTKKTVSPFSKPERLEYQLPAPEGLEAVSFGYRSVRLKWNNVGADGYTIYRSVKGEGKFKAVKTIAEDGGSATEYEVTGLATGVSYDFQAVPYHLSGSSRIYGEASETITAAARPAAAPAITISVTGADSIKIKWERSEGADGYELKEAGSGRVLDVLDAKTLSYEWKGLDADREYEAVLIPYKNVKKEPVMGEESRIRFRLNTGLEGGQTEPPVIKEVKALSSNTLAVSFGAVDGALGYGIYRSETAAAEDSDYVLIGNTVTNVFKDENLECGKTYYYKVCVMTLERGQADEPPQIKYHALSARSMSGTPVPASDVLGKISVRQVSNVSCQLSWKKNPDASGYLVYRSEEKEGRYEIVKKITKTSWKDARLSPGKVYYYKVVPYKKVRGGQIYGEMPEEAVSFTALPGVPKIGSVKKSGYQSVVLNWKRTPGISGYKIYESDLKKEGFEEVFVLPVANTSPAAISVQYKSSRLQPNQTAYFKISAYIETENGILESELSAGKAMKLLPDKPELFLKAENGDKMSISWKDQEADGYLLYRSDKKSSSYQLIADTKETGFMDSKSRLVPGKTYYYKLRAYKVTEKGLLYSAYSSAASGKLLLAAPEPVLEKGTDNCLSWKAVKGAEKYEIYRASSKNGTYKLLGETDGLSFFDSSLSQGKTYYYKVRAYQTRMLVLMKKKVYGEYSAAVH